MIPFANRADEVQEKLLDELEVPESQRSSGASDAQLQFTWRNWSG